MEAHLENAFIKASKISEITGEIVIADDSGIEIDFLGKAPGVNSANFLVKRHLIILKTDIYWIE